MSRVRAGTPEDLVSRRRRMRSAPPPVLIALIGLAAVAQSFGRFTYALLLPAIEGDLPDSYTAPGLLGTTTLAAYLVATVAVSCLAQRCSPRALLLAGLAITTTGLGQLWRAEGIGTLGTGLAATGFGGALIWDPRPAGRIRGEPSAPRGRRSRSGLAGLLHGAGGHEACE